MKLRAAQMTKYIYVFSKDRYGVLRIKNQQNLACIARDEQYLFGSTCKRDWSKHSKVLLTASEDKGREN